MLVRDVHGLRRADGGDGIPHAEERPEAARKAAYLWNIGKVVRADIGE